MVRVVKGGKTIKGESKFSEVMKVYKYSLLLRNGNVWNRGKIVKVLDCVRRKNISDVDTKSVVTKSLSNTNNYSKVSVRDKSLLKLPKKLEDLYKKYVFFIHILHYYEERGCVMFYYVYAAAAHCRTLCVGPMQHRAIECEGRIGEGRPQQL
ncbi:hypothetical protein NDU88_003813 [Pleurodeles waltl]|uniref:Uncharacterized protein n=1 Tax=Pleurodeles waltl TaxID=8319 RepID=A0AAV7UF63_PLEWA|nr:hypothetical protein NDU88_003813 [Pleurodeles waltl]